MNPGKEIDLISAVLERFPDLAGKPYRVLTESWSCTALDVDDRFIFKFPRDAEARVTLEREAGLLAALQGRLTLTVPDLAIHAARLLFSSHAKIPGQQLLAATYVALPEAAKRRLGHDIGRFYAELHRIDPAEMVAAGATPVEAWSPADEVRARAVPLLADELRAEAHALLDAYATLAPDPLGVVFGFFDGHGWNMAFDSKRMCLNGIYDFGDSGLGSLHQEFVYAGFISTDLTRRIVDAYEAETGCALDRARIDVLTGVHRLWELACSDGDPSLVPAMVRGVVQWRRGREAWASTSTRLLKSGP